MADSARGPHHRFFFDDRGEPQLARCAVVFIDLLGITWLARSDDAARYLRTLNEALSGSRDYLADDSTWPAAYFSDSLVIVSPVEGDDVGAAVVGLVEQIAEVQLDLFEHGYALRGGLAVGNVHISRNLLFGSGYIDAYTLESSTAREPRVVLSPEAVEAIGEPLTGHLLVDQDEHVFVDYMTAGVLRSRWDSAESGMESHRDRIVSRRAQHETNIAVWSKWNWVGQYHNDVCGRLFGERPQLVVPGVGGRSFRSFG